MKYDFKLNTVYSKQELIFVFNYIVCFQWRLKNQKNLKHILFFGATWEVLEKAVNFT
jgi:hypothetical protein